MMAVNPELLEPLLLGDVLTLQHIDLIKAMADKTRMYYCPTCDCMATLGRIPQFRAPPGPWRSDVFRFGVPNL